MAHELLVTLDGDFCVVIKRLLNEVHTPHMKNWSDSSIGIGISPRTKKSRSSILQKSGVSSPRLDRSLSGICSQ